MSRRLLSFVELGRYPNFAPLYQGLGYSTEVVTSGRKVIARLKKSLPDALVAEFNYNTDFRDRTSALESVLAVLQRSEGVRIVVFYDAEFQPLLDALYERFPIFSALAYPIDEAALQELLS